jgi:hypothetical protein
MIPSKPEDFEMAQSMTVFKYDGTQQCEPDTKARPLTDDVKAITDLGIKIIGEGKHLQLPVPAKCHTPTGWANVFEIDKANLNRNQLFRMSALGFKVLAHDDERLADAGGQDTPVPLDLSLSANLLELTGKPEAIRDLVGYQIRVYKTGDMITRDHRDRRINFETDPNNHTIVRSWFG